MEKISHLICGKPLWQARQTFLTKHICRAQKPLGEGAPAYGGRQSTIMQQYGKFWTEEKEQEGIDA